MYNIQCVKLSELENFLYLIVYNHKVHRASERQSPSGGERARDEDGEREVGGRGTGEDGESTGVGKSKRGE